MVDGSVWFGLSDARAASDRDGRERRSAGMELTIVAPANGAVEHDCRC